MLAGLSLIVTITLAVVTWPSLVTRLFVSTPYAPHGICLLWEPGLIMLRMLMNSAIGFAYMAISISLIALVAMLRNKLPFHWTFLAFGGFILFCGITHFTDVLTLWYPYYWFDGAMRVLTAFASVLTALVIPFQVRPINDLIERARATEQSRRERDLLYKQQEEAVVRLQGALESRERDLLTLLERLRESESLFRMALRGSGTSVYFADETLCYRWVYNPPAPLQSDTMIGRSDGELFEPAMAAQLRDLKRRALSEESEQRVDVITQGSDGERVFEVRAQPAKTGLPGQIGVVGIVADITARKLLEERLSQSQRMESVGRLAGGIAHDFNNLLMVILGNLELVKDDLPLNHTSQVELQEISRAAEQAAQLTGQLLTVARRQPHSPQVTSLNAIVQGIEAVLSRIVAPLTLELKLDAAPLPIYADPQQIEQVLINLVQNARDAVNDSGTVTVLTGTQLIEVAESGSLPIGYYACLEVRDAGSGIAPDVLAKVFEPFFSTKGSRGSGLGLAICYSIISQHSGAIRLESRVDHGTTAQVLLPVSSFTIDETPIGEQRPLGRGELVLLVEDQPAVRELVTRMLRDLGYRAVKAADGIEALGLLDGADLRPDIILTDVLMPNLDGAGLVMRLRAQWPDLPVLFMSGYSDGRVSNELEDLLHSPRTARMHKPFAITLLAQKLRQLLDKA